MVKYKPIEFDIFSPKMLIENQVNSLYTFTKMSERIIDEHEDLSVAILRVDMRL